MSRITAVGEWYGEYTRETDPPLIDLGPATRASCQQPVRRIDRFIQLALIGSARCVGSRSLPRETGIYLASGSGPVSSTATVHDQMFQQKMLPKPAQFINTLANTAGFYVARNLGVEGQCLFVSRGVSAFEAALELAMVDLAVGALDAALVGMVEECVWPLAEHAHRLRHPDAGTVAEGSLWLLLERGTAEPGRDAAMETVDTLAGIAALEQWLQAQPRTARYWHNPALDRAAATILQCAADRNGWLAWPETAGESPLRAALAASRFLGGTADGVLISVNVDREGYYQVCRYRAGSGIVSATAE